jgi:uncharacterized membrane protein YcfT
MNIKGIPLQDLITIASIAISIILGLMHKFSAKLPPKVAEILNGIGQDEIERYLTEAVRLYSDPTARREWVVKQIQTIARTELHIEVPTSVANLLVEYVFQRWKIKNS